MTAFRTSTVRTPRVRKPKKRRSPGPRGRITKKTGDVRNLPDEGKVEKAPGKIGGKAIRHLRALGHHLDAIVQIGKDGITDGVVAATKAALLAHELVKVRILADAPVER